MSSVEVERVDQARAYLQEAVFRSRGAQAGAGLFAAGDPSRANCGLGARAEVVLDLTPRGEELFRALWPAGLAAAALEDVRARTTAWVERQDALDRDRNHFLKAFRTRHGFDRTAWDDERRTAYEAGLAEVNGRVDAELTDAARALAAVQ